MRLSSTARTAPRTAPPAVVLSMQGVSPVFGLTEPPRRYNGNKTSSVVTRVSQMAPDSVILTVVAIAGAALLGLLACILLAKHKLTKAYKT